MVPQPTKCVRQLTRRVVTNRIQKRSASRASFTFQKRLDGFQNTAPETLQSQKLRSLLDWYTIALCKDLTSLHSQPRNDIRQAVESHLIQTSTISDEYLIEQEERLIQLVQRAREIRRDIRGDRTDRTLSDIRQFEDSQEVLFQSGIQPLRKTALLGLRGCVAYLDHAERLQSILPETSYPIEQRQHLFDSIFELIAQMSQAEILASSWKSLFSNIGQLNNQIVSLLSTIHNENFNGWHETVSPSSTTSAIVSSMAPGRCVCVTGPDLAVLRRVLESTNKTGIIVFSYGAMTRAHVNPFLAGFPHLHGPVADLTHFPGPILLTGNLPDLSRFRTTDIFSTANVNVSGTRRVDVFRNGGGMSHFVATANSMGKFKANAPNDTSLGVLEIGDVLRSARDRGVREVGFVSDLNNDGDGEADWGMNVICGGDISSTVAMGQRLKSGEVEFEGTIVFGDIELDAKVVSCLLGLSYLDMMDVTDARNLDSSLYETISRI